MPSEEEAVAGLSEGEFRWLEVWNWQVGALDQKAGILVTLDGILLALTASFVGTVLSSSVPLLPRIFFAASTILVLFSAAACTRVIWIRFYATKIIAEEGTISKAYPKMFQSRANKMGYLHIGILALLAALAGYAGAILILLARA